VLWFSHSLQQSTKRPLCHPSPLVGWAGELEEKGKTYGLGQGQFNRTTKEVNSSHTKTEKNIQSKGIHRAVLSQADA